MDIMSLLNGNLGGFDMSGLARKYNEMSQDQKDEIDIMVGTMLSKAFRITMRDSEVFRNWLEQVIRSKQIDTTIDNENY